MKRARCLLSALALTCAAIGAATGSPYWFALANIGFLINLFNLIPFPPLDGSHIAAVFSLGNWDFVLITLLLWVFYSAQIVLFGAEFTQVYATTYGSYGKPSQGGVKFARKGVGVDVDARKRSD